MTATDAELRQIEHRPERQGHQANPSTLVHPNGSLMVCGDVDLIVSLTRAVLAEVDPK